MDGENGNFDIGLTIGLSNKFAFQWQNQNATSKRNSGPFTIGGDTITLHGNKSKTTANQFNVLYSLDKSFAGFIGYTQAKNEIDGLVTDNGNLYRLFPGKTVNGW